MATDGAREAARLGLEANACVRVAQTVDAIFVHSTAFLVQSRCGRVVVLCYPESITLGGEPVAVHSGFYRILRSTRWTVLQEPRRVVDGRSLLDPSRTVEHALEVLSVTRHSLGGAMVVLFALSIAGHAEQAWRRAESPLAQLQSVREIPRTLRSLVGTHEWRSAARYTLRDHGPHHPIAALRPAGRVTEFGDHE